MKAFLDLDDPPPRRDLALPPQERLGYELKTMFNTLTAGPLPDRLLQLADALEEAYQQGQLVEVRREDRAS